MKQIEKSNLNQIEVEINFYKGQAVQSIFEIGKRLIKAKELVEHGEWENWLNEKVDISNSRAREFMRVTREFSNQQTSVALTLDKMLALTAVPKEERETFIEENPVEDMTTRELRQAIKDKKELEEKVKQLENQEPVVIEKEVEKIVEVTPSDYDSLKKIQQLHANQCYENSKLEGELQRLKRELEKEGVSKEEYNKLKKEYEEKVNEVHDLKDQVKQIVITDTKEIHIKKLQDTAIVFSNRVHSFINDVGGLGWLVDYLNELPDYEKQEYIKSLDLLDRWVTTIKTNL